MIVFGLCLPKKEEKKLRLPIVNIKKYIYYEKKIQIFIRTRGGVQPMWMIIKFYNIGIKSANMEKGGGV